MSRTVESKVVEMKFDNSNFEKNVKTSMTTLEKLKEKLSMPGLSKSMSSISDTANKLDLSGLMMATETVTTKFSALEAIAVGALMRIGQRAIDTGINLVKGMSIDQVTAGWTKYEQKTSNVQTLMNSTGKSIDEINGYLDQLMWYSDETSFGFTDMTSALSTMVSSGGDIEKLIPMIMGMGNATAYAGKGAGEFQRVIYNLNQSYSQGFLSTMDWRSVENAGAASIQLKQYLMEAAEELGDIQKGTADVANWATYLSKKQISSEAMEIAFNRFAEYTNAVKAAVDDGTYETATEAMQAMGTEGFGEVGVKAFQSAQQAKTFADAIDATKDAVSSGWMSIFQTIFGDIEQSTELWTRFCNDLWDIFASGFEDKIDFIGQVMGAAPFDEFADRFSEKTGSAIFGDLPMESLKAMSEYNYALKDAIEYSGTLENAIDQGRVAARDYGEALEITAEKAEVSSSKYADIISEISEFTGMTEDSVIETYQIGKRFGKTNEEFLKEVNKLADGEEKQAQKILEYYDKIGYSSDIFTQNQIEGFREIAKSLKEEEGEYYELYSAQKLFYEDYSGADGEGLSGRDYLVSSFFNVLESLMEVMSAIKEAWKDVFPAKTAVQIQVILKAVRDFTEKLYPTTLQVGLLRASFRGFFSILGIGVDAVKAAFSVFKRLFGLISVDGEETLKKIAGIANKITAFRESLAENGTFEKIGDKIFNGLKKAIDGFVLLIGKLKEVGTAIKDFVSNSEKIQNAITKVREGIPAFLSTAGAAIKDFGSGSFTKISEIFATIVGHIQDFINSFKRADDAVGDSKFAKFADILETVWEKLWNLIKLLGGGLWKGMQTLGKTISNAMSGLDFSDASSIFVDVLSTGVLLNFSKLLKNLFDSFSEGTGLLDALADDLGAVGDALASLSLDIKADALFKIGEAILLMAVALVMLSGVEYESLKTAVLAISTLVGELVGMIALMEQFNTEITGPKSFINTFSQNTQITAASKAMKNMAVSVLILAAALYMISKIDENRLLSSLGVITGLITELTIVALVLSKYSGKMTTGTKGLSKMAIAVILLAAAMKILASIEPERLKDSLTTTVELIGALTLAVFMLSTGGKNANKAAEALIAMAAALIVLSAAVFLFGKMDPDVLEQGLLAVGIAILGLTFAALLLSQTGAKVLIAAVGLVILAGALVVLAGAVKLFGEMDPDVLKQGLLAVTAILVEFVIAALIATAVVGGIIALSLGLLVFAAALAVLTPELILLGKNAKTVGKGLLVLAGALLVFLAAALGAMLVAPGILILTTGLIALGVACLAVGVGISALATGFALLGTMGAVGAAGVVAFLEVLVVGIINMIPVIIVAIGNGIKLILQMLIELIPTFGEFLTTLIITLCDILIDLVPKLLETLGVLLTSLLDFLVEMTPKFVESAVLIMAGFMEGLAESIPELINAAFDLIIAFNNGLADAIDEKFPELLESIENVLHSIWEAVKKLLEKAVDKIKELGTKIMESGFVQGIKDKIQAVKDKAKEIVDNLKKGISDGLEKIKQAAKDLVDGLIKGIKDKFNEIKDMGKELGSKILGGIKEFLGIASPSKEMAKVGEFADEGLIVGLERYSNKVSNAAEDVGDAALSSMNDSLNRGLSKVFDDAEDFNPVIRPTLDLSNITAGVRTVNSMFETNPIGVDGRFIQNDAELAVKATLDDIYADSKFNADEIIRAIRENGKTNVNVSLEGDASQFFRAMQYENNKYKRTSRGVGGFA